MRVRCRPSLERELFGAMPMIDVYAAAGTFGDKYSLAKIVARAAGDAALAQRTWVLLTESPEGGWGIAGHANTQADIAASARAALSAGT
jgi:phenylpyruvate tautomerase PptA (4-oxalocrotonate tautomerase family)